jgi:ATP-dependent DNA helicase PIF1
VKSEPFLRTLQWNPINLSCLHSRIIDAEIMTGPHINSCVFISQITLTPSDTNLPFVLKRRQFSIRVAFSMTINKSQGQTLNHVGLYLPQPVFSHGQLYVTLSRIILYQCIKVLINDDQKYQTKNVVYSEIFQ